jgi:DNA-binding MarR family transcriptional regulator
MEKTLTLQDYQSLASLRYQIRRFLRFSEEVARSRGLEPRQYQLMLGIKGLPERLRPNIGVLAEQMQIQHHSAVELVNRLAQGGYVRRQRSTDDRREVLLELTNKGEKTLRELAIHHRTELRTVGPALLTAIRNVIQPSRSAGSTRKSLRSKGESVQNAVR